ncbi:hypothetical protein BpHYR1_022346 [Brachionus plicatilis]|uniref:Uncharacterized protein n=1 Tax=Brachionus plicatilis TaxID=10195 RepID=A0A3M7T2P8_BRAPC|nr:hypothetical protein BpHYR1_022346 [Brachionus plicatilis]
MALKKNFRHHLIFLINQDKVYLFLLPLGFGQLEEYYNKKKDKKSQIWDASKRHHKLRKKIHKFNVFHHHHKCSNKTLNLSESKSRESVLLDPIGDMLNVVEDIPYTQILKKNSYDLIELVLHILRDF